MQYHTLSLYVLKWSTYWCIKNNVCFTIMFQCKHSWMPLLTHCFHPKSKQSLQSYILCILASYWIITYDAAYVLLNAWKYTSLYNEMLWWRMHCFRCINTYLTLLNTYNDNLWYCMDYYNRLLTAVGCWGECR